MIKLFTKFKTIILFLLVAVFIFWVVSFNKNDKVQYVEAATLACKGPADVMLVIDRSGTMGSDSKFSSAKSASADFVDKLFSAIPDNSFDPFDYHQVGLIAFNQNIDTEKLNQDGSVIKSYINDPDGVLGENSGYPVGSRNTAIAIQQARLKMDLVEGGNPYATKTMIVLTDGVPNDLDAAKAQADTAKNEDNNIRIISVGLKLDRITDETIKEEAKEFIKYIASSPVDCYYISDSGNTLDNCTSIDASELGIALDGVYNSITAAVCDESPPTISISKKPSGTLYNVDNLTITSTAADDVGFKSHEIKWSDDWPNNLRTVECADLTGTIINCNTGDLGPFTTEGAIVTYRSIAVDANDNEANIDPQSVTVASIGLTVPVLLRNTNNTVRAVISNYGEIDDISISIDALDLEGVEINKTPMSCSVSGTVKTCTYIFNPGCDWTGGITDGAANNINVDVYIYAESGDVGIRQIASSVDNILTSPGESDSDGNCLDGINNDCDYKDNDPLKPIIDLNPGLEEALCDVTGPSVGILRDPSGDVYDDDSTIFTSNATDSNGIKQHIIYYKINDGSLQTAFECNDADVDSLCDEDASQNIGSISVTIGLLAAGIKIDYYSEAVDYSGNDNTGSSSTEDFIVKNRECEDVGDLGGCLVTENAKCCDKVCNVAISNPFSYNTEYCAKEVCNGASWEWDADDDADEVYCSASGEPSDCYSFSSMYGPPPGEPEYFWDGGCEDRAYRCSSGYCNYEVENIKGDYCGWSLVLNDYECVDNLCVLSPDPATENDICDIDIDFIKLRVRDEDGVLITDSSPEVLDNKTDKVIITGYVADTNGIASYKIYWQVNGGSWQNKDCGSCDPNTEATACNCTQEIGPFAPNDVVSYYIWAQDNSSNKNQDFDGVDYGLKYKYYNGTNFSTYKGSDIDASVNHIWGSGKILINSNSWETEYSTASIVWEGLVQPDELGSFDFSVKSDDGIRVYLDGNRVIDKWIYYSSDEYSADYNFSSFDAVPIKIEWFEYVSDANMQLGQKISEDSTIYPIPLDLITPYSFTVRDNECYDIPGGSKADLTLCDSGSGRCCGGTCDSAVSSTSYDEGCYVDACSGTNWVYAAGNEGASCGSTDTCFDYYSFGNSFYSGCITGGNECSAGYCTILSATTSISACSGNLLTNYNCDPDNETGTCEPKDSNIICSDSGNYDNDEVDCNCDCNGYDLEEKIYSSLSFDGVDDYVTIPNDSSLNPEKITLEAWVYPTSFNYYATIIKKGNLFIRFYSNTGRVQGYAYTGNSPYYCYTSSDVAASLNQWNHIVFTYDGNMGKVYINGMEGCSYLSTGDIYSSSSSLSIGNYYGSSNPKYYNIKGMIDEVRMYNRALYPEEVQDHYNGIFVDNTGLVGYWNFDEETGGTVYDYHDDTLANNNNGTLSNVDGIIYGANWDIGKYGTGLDFDGSNDYVSVPSINPVNEITVSAWVKSSSPDGYSGINQIVSKNNAYVLGTDSIGGKNMCFMIYDTTWRYGSCYAVPDPENWHHFIGTYNKLTQEKKLYVDGVLRDTTNPSGAIRSDTGSIHIGRKEGYSNYFNGLIDEVRIYSRALSEIEAADHYKGIFSDNSGLVGYWDFNKGTGTIAYDSSENGPQWMKHYHGSVVGAGGNVPENWQACTDGKDNDCDGAAVAEKDEYDTDPEVLVSDCDGEVDAISVIATAKDRTCIDDPDCTEGSDLFGESNINIELFDSDIRDSDNDFTITANAFDDFLIYQTRIEWTTDNWGTIYNKTCSGAGACVACAEGGTCGEGNDEIPSSLLSADSVFKFKICAVDNSVNNNQKCTDEYSIDIKSSNAVPVITPLSVIEPNFCVEGLKYVLKWEFEDDGDAQASFEIQVKENDFESQGDIIIDKSFDLPDSFYQINFNDFETGERIEYGEKEYYWRVKVMDNRGGGYSKTTEWEAGLVIITPLYEYPQVSFSAVPDYSDNCLYEIDAVGTDKCDYGENIMFSDDSIFIECIDANNKECLTTSVAKCDTTNNTCVPCEDGSECVKFNAPSIVSYSCISGICEASGSCGIDDDCRATDFARCDIDPETGIGLCVVCDNDLQCTNDKFGTTGIDYFCNNEGKCEDKEHRMWWFYGDDSLDVDSRDPNPINNYIESEVDNYNVILKIKDIFGNSCSKVKRIIFGINKYPKWNEVSSSN